MRHATLPACLLTLAALWAPLALTSTASAQIEPGRLYNTVNRPIVMDVARPENVQGALAIAILEPVTGRALERKATQAGEVDLAVLFPQLWAAPVPETRYVQLYAGDQPVGPAVVLQPMIDPAYVIDETLNNEILESARNGNVERIQRLLDPFSRVRRQIGKVSEFSFPTGDNRTFTGYRAYVDQNVVIETDRGEIEIILRPDVAPNTVFNFLHLVEGGFYNDILVDRVVPGPPPFGFQLGDPTGQKTGGPGYAIDLEYTLALPHDFGVVSLARNPRDPDSGGSQIFICLSREACSFLDGKYASFGQVVRGVDTMLDIESVEVGGMNTDVPQQSIVVRNVRAVPAPPYPQK
ncbi:MAG: peptidylprolyl isomerase, partial [Planctomycetota bacterium]|nr:peptidylprolyl isomerase [Planctomycetota bacterium]